MPEAQECAELVDLIKTHLVDSGIPSSNPSWEIKKTRSKGRGVFAKRDIEPGEIVFVDYPLIIGPRACGGQVCAVCFAERGLGRCLENCGSILCGACQGCAKHEEECAKIISWAKSKIDADISKCLTPIRALFLGGRKRRLVRNLVSHSHPQHGVEVDFLKGLGLVFGEDEEELLRLTCAVFDANAFQVLTDKGGSARGLYPLAAITNHNCVPNTGHVFDCDNYMIVRACVRIRKGEEIFNSYCRLLWGTMSRRYHLLITKHFACQCHRCKDREEFGTRLNAISCPKCQGDMFARDPLKSKSAWCCQQCQEIIAGSKAIFIMNTISAGFLNITEVDKALRFYQDAVGKIVPDSSQVVVEMKYRLIFSLGNEEGYLYENLSDQLLELKLKFCQDILGVINRLGIGVRKITGIVLYELITCMREIFKRSSDVNNNKDFKGFNDEVGKLLVKVADNCLFDVGAPKEIQDLWKKNGVKTNWRDYYKMQGF